ncbi:MAG TPA: MAPEG family protein [Ramlibacter sp.]|nr:MAPEG family protein [Ramlibacter sp.]
MDIPTWMLLGFAGWTLLLLVVTVGIFRWTRIVTGRRRISDFRADGADGADWYLRGTRAHANCIENLPVFGAVVFALQATHTGGGLVDLLSCTVLAARIVQSLVHVCWRVSDRTVSLRFSFYLVQAVCFIVLGAMAASRAAGAGA